MYISSQPLPWSSKLSSGASCFHWSSLSGFYGLIGVHNQIQLIGHDLERHTPVYIRSHSSQCMSEHKPNMGLSKELYTSETALSWGTNLGKCTDISAVLKVPMSTVASICKWKKFETTRTLPRAGWPSKLSDRGRRALVREVTKNPMVTLSAPAFLCGERRTFQKDNHLCSNPPIRSVW